jgi:hypothetical protein
MAVRAKPRNSNLNFARVGGFQLRIKKILINFYARFKFKIGTGLPPSGQEISGSWICGFKTEGKLY